MHTNEITYDTFIPRWFGRLGNNIQQISNGIYFCEKNNVHFTSPDHPMIGAIDLPFGTNEFRIKDNSNNWFYFYNGEESDFDVDVNDLNLKRKEICEKYIFPKLKIDHSVVSEPLADDVCVVHIRSGDLYTKWPKTHTQNPLIYYIKLHNLFNGKVVYVAEDKQNPIVEYLELTGVNVRVLDTKETYELLLRARCLATSGSGSYAISAAFCSKNIKKLYCTNLWLENSINPLMLKEQLEVYSMDIDDNKYIKVGEWTRSDALAKLFTYNENTSFRRL